MFGIGTWELLLILFLALILLGPTKLPEVSKSLGQALSKLRRTAEEVRREIDLEGVERNVRECDPGKSTEPDSAVAGAGKDFKKPEDPDKRGLAG
jgi:sec-independent protein translocase protein TatB